MKNKEQTVLLEASLENDVVNLFKALANPARTKIIYALRQQELTVTEISEAVGMSQSAISHHLKDLKMARLVSNRKEGRKVIYHLDDDHVYQLFDIAIAHVKEIYNYE